MTVDVVRAGEDELAEWDDHIEASPQGTVFHATGWLRVLERHSGGTLHPLLGYKGQEVAGLFPLFELSKGPITAVFSPPPRLGVPRLGPALRNYRKLRQRKRERRNRRFIEGCLDWIDSEVAPSYVHVMTTPAYHDVRPFDWNGFDLRPRYTYSVPAGSDEEAVLDRFTSSARRNIRAIDDDCEVRHAGADGAELIARQVRDRFAAQNEEPTISTEYVIDLFRTLPDGQMNVYIGEVDGERVSGVIAPVDQRAVYFWQGGVKPDTDQPINELLHWRIITDAIDGEQNEYDLVGANTPRICRYKSKFNPRLDAYYELERSTKLTGLAASVYRRLQ